MSTTDRASEITSNLRERGHATRADVDQLTEWAKDHHKGRKTALFSFGYSGGTVICGQHLSATDYLSEVGRALRDLRKHDKDAFGETQAVLTALKTFFEEVCCEQDPDEHRAHTQRPHEYAH